MTNHNDRSTKMTRINPNAQLQDAEAVLEQFVRDQPTEGQMNVRGKADPRPGTEMGPTLDGRLVVVTGAVYDAAADVTTVMVEVEPRYEPDTTVLDTFCTGVAASYNTHIAELAESRG